jgi:ribosomal protein S18 acetylase RimI-like enzyme
MPWQLKCVVANTNAMGFYSALGFEIVSTHEDENPPYALLRKSGA